MRLAGLTILVLCASAAFATAHKKHTPTRQEQKYLARLLKRCDDGNGQACYDYAKLLQQLDRKKNEKLAVRYIHRACTLAYLPACNRATPVAQARDVSSTGPAKPETGACSDEMISSATLQPINLAGGAHGQQITRLQSGSLLEKAGLKSGDVVSKINGSELTNTGQITKALKDGGAMIEVVRGKSIVPLALSCK
jgi:hypothetical protein